MSDFILATLLLVGGAGWSFIIFMAYANHPTPSQADFGVVFVAAGPVAFLLGLFWWVWLIVRWFL